MIQSLRSFFFVVPLLVCVAVPAAAQVCNFSTIILQRQSQVDAFDCTEVTGDLTVGSVFINSDITDLTPLSELTSVGGGLGIGGNDALASLDGLDNLTSVGGLSIGNNAALTSIDGLGNLAFVGGSLAVTNNDALTSINGLGNLASVGRLLIYRNDALASLDGLGNLTSVNSGLTIEDNTALTSLDGLVSLTSVGGSFSTFNNDALTSINGLGNLTSVGRTLNISSNDVLTSINGLGNLTSVGGLFIGGNEALTSINGLGNLASVGDDLFFIGGNEVLTSIDGFSNLTSVSGDLRINDNEALVSLDGLGNISSVGDDLLVEENATLRQCSCGLSGLVSGDPPAFSGVGGNVSISANDPGGQCNSPQEVLDDTCPTTDAEPTDDVLPEAFALAPAYPNPFANEARIGFAVPEATDVRLVVYDVLGREVAVLVDEEVMAGRHEAVLDGTDLPSGTYLVRLATESQTETQPLSLVR